jgi:hypothetical protein
MTRVKSLRQSQRSEHSGKNKGTNNGLRRGVDHRKHSLSGVHLLHPELAVARLDLAHGKKGPGRYALEGLQGPTHDPKVLIKRRDEESTARNAAQA